VLIEDDFIDLVLAAILIPSSMARSLPVSSGPTTKATDQSCGRIYSQAIEERSKILYGSFDLSAP
jgi:hypothetical protein